MRFTSRKFILAAVTLLVASVLLLLGDIGPTIWRDVVLGTVGVYIAGNVAQKASKPRSAQGTSKAHAKPSPEQIRRFNELQKQQESGKR